MIKYVPGDYVLYVQNNIVYRKSIDRVKINKDSSFSYIISNICNDIILEENKIFPSYTVYYNYNKTLHMSYEEYLSDTFDFIQGQLPKDFFKLP